MNLLRASALLNGIYWLIKIWFCFQYLQLIFHMRKENRTWNRYAVLGAAFLALLAGVESANWKNVSLGTFFLAAAVIFLLAQQMYQGEQLLLAGHILFYLLIFQLLDKLVLDYLVTGKRDLFYYPLGALLCVGFWKIFRNLYLREKIRMDSRWLFVFDCLGLTAVLCFLNRDWAGQEVARAWRIFLILLAAMILLFAASVFWQQSRHRAELLEMRQTMLENNYRNVLELYRQNARLFHDFRAHLRILRSYAEENRTEEILHYIEELSGPMERIEPVNQTGNQILDQILNWMGRKAKEQGIELRIQADPLGELPAADSDLCAILSNLLDNALENCDPAEPVVEVKIRKRNQILILVVRNPWNGEKRSKKERNSLHGIGLDSVRLSVEKGQGSLEIRQEKGVFEASVILPLVH